MCSGTRSPVNVTAVKADLKGARLRTRPGTSARTTSPAFNRGHSALFGIQLSSCPAPSLACKSVTPPHYLASCTGGTQPYLVSFLVLPPTACARSRP